MNSPLDREWPEQDLEEISKCPYCGGHERMLAFGAVQDWSFHCAPGKWDYWDCINCKSLYLDPRPTLSSIGAAYEKYYTHNNGEPNSFVSSMKARIINECLSQKVGANIEPRLHLPKLMDSLISSIGKKVIVPFGLMTLVNHQKGKLMDVGCGAGLMVAMAQQLGWDAMGLEIDPIAVRAAQKRGLNILEGTYEYLLDYKHEFDCIVCAHVLEHVHDPLDLIAKLIVALKPGGTLLLSLPNSQSALRYHFGADWRGLEAPRHLAIPSEIQLIKLLVSNGFTVHSTTSNQSVTVAESYRIRRRGSFIEKQDLINASQLDLQQIGIADGNDFIRLICDAPQPANLCKS